PESAGGKGCAVQGFETAAGGVVPECGAAVACDEDGGGALPQPDIAEPQVFQAREKTVNHPRTGVLTAKYAEYAKKGSGRNLRFLSACSAAEGGWHRVHHVQQEGRNF